MAKKHVLIQGPAPKPLTIMDIQGQYHGDVLANVHDRAAGMTPETSYVSKPLLERIFFGLPLRISKLIKSEKK